MRKNFNIEFMAIILALLICTIPAFADDGSGVQTVKAAGQATIVKGDETTALNAALLDAEKNAVLKAANMIIDQNDNRSALVDYLSISYQQFLVEKPVLLNSEKSGGTFYVVASIQIDESALRKAVREQVKKINAALKAAAQTKANVAMILNVAGTTLMSADDAEALVQSGYLENLREAGIMVVSTDAAESPVLTTTDVSLAEYQTRMLAFARSNPGWTYLGIGQVNVNMNKTLNGYQAVADVEMLLYDNKKQVVIKNISEAYRYSARTMQIAEIGVLTKVVNGGSKSMADDLMKYYQQESDNAVSK